MLAILQARTSSSRLPGKVLKPILGEPMLARRNAAVPRGVGHATPVYAERAENAELWDVEGRRYVDFAGGIAVLNTGHRHPKVMAAVAEQAERFTHTAFQVMAYEPYIRLAERLNAKAPFKGPAKTIFFTTGAEAAENAVKIARSATGRTGIIAFSGAFHGRTMMTMALTGKVLPYKKSFGPIFKESRGLRRFMDAEGSADLTCEARPERIRRHRLIQPGMKVTLQNLVIRVSLERTRFTAPRPARYHERRVDLENFLASRSFG